MSGTITINKTSPIPSGAGKEFARLVIYSLAGAAGLALAGAWPTHRIAEQAGLIAMAVGIGISFLGSILAALPIAFSRGTTPSSRQISFMGAMAARMFSTLILFATAALCHVVSNTPLAVWTGLSYLVLLTIETVAAVSMIKQREGSSR